MSEAPEEKQNSEQHHHHHHHHHHEEHGEKKVLKKTGKKKKAPLKREAVILLCVLLGLAAGLFIVWKSDSREPESSVLESMSAAVKESVPDDSVYEKWNSTNGETEPPEAVVTFQGKQYRQRKDLSTLLLMGLDVYGLKERVDKMENRQQADFLMLVGIDEAEKKGFVLHINRDTMTDVMMKDVQGKNAGRILQQICLSHNYGKDETDACENTLDAVSNLLYGTTIDHYLCTTMDSVEYLNDAAGGVTLTCLDDFPGDDELKAGKEVTLMGQKALKYVRSRMEMPDDTNERRMERQQQYLTALREKCVEKSKADPDFMLQSLLHISENLVSDCRVNELSDIANAAISYDFGDILTIQGESVQGQVYAEFYADEDALQKQVIDLFYEEVR